MYGVLRDISALHVLHQPCHQRLRVDNVPAVVSSTMMRGSASVVPWEREEGGGAERDPEGGRQAGRRQGGREGKRGRSRRERGKQRGRRKPV